MAIEEIIRLIFSLLGGGIAVAIINWINTNRIDKKNRKIESLRAQIEKLYGQLYFWVKQNKICFEHYRRIEKAYDDEYCKKEWSKDDKTQKALVEEAKLVINIKNEYINQVTKNNDTIINLINNNYSYVDIDDMEMFNKYVLDYLRGKNEFDENGKLKIPLSIYEILKDTAGEISYMENEFIEKIEERYKFKKNELDELVNSK